MASDEDATLKQAEEEERPRVDMAYDDVLCHLGEFGKYQRRIYLLLCLPAISCGLHKLGGVFLQGRAEHRCLLPFEKTNATYDGLPRNIANLSLPWNSQTQTWVNCKRYDADFTPEYFSSGVPANFTVYCDDWVYDNSNYHSTTLTEWDLVCRKAWMKATSDSFFMVGVLLGSIIFGALSDRSGRRPAFFYSLVLQVVAGILAGLAPDFYTFTLARLAVGASTSGVFLVAYVIALEMVGPKKRMFAGVACQLFFTAGFIGTAGFAYLIRDWRTLQIALTLPGIFFFSYYWFVPESARWLLTKGRTQEAKQLLLMVAKENKVEIPNDVLDSLILHSDKDAKQDKALSGEKPSILDLFRYSNLRRKAFIIFFLWFVNSGTYYGLSWNTPNLGGNEYVNFVLSGLVEVPAYSFLLLTLNRWGRKTIQCGSMLVAGLTLLSTVIIPQGHPTLALTFAMLGKLAITASYGTIYIFSAEQFPTVIRNIGMGASSTFARFGGIMAPYINIMAEVWKPLPLVTFGVLALVGGMLALLLPETHNRKLPDSINDGERFGKKSEFQPDDLEVMQHMNGLEKEEK